MRSPRRCRWRRWRWRSPDGADPRPDALPRLRERRWDAVSPASDAAMTKRVAILGSTGSIGANTLDVIARHREDYEVVALAAGKNDAVLLEQCIAHRPRHAVMADAAAAERL